MSLESVKSWTVNKKLIVSLSLLLATMLFFGVVVAALTMDDIIELTEGEVSKKIENLAKESAESKIGEMQAFKWVKEIISETDTGLLNRGFYANTIYNLFTFCGLGLLFAWMFQPKGLNSIETENKTPVLFLASIIISLKVQQIGMDALNLSEALGLYEIQENLLGISPFDDIKSMITSYVMIFPNAERGWLITLIGLALIPAVGEEIMFRGYLMKLFNQRINHHNSIAITALLFALIHFQMTYFLYYFILGVILGYVYYWGKNILFPIIIHFIHNGLVLLVFLEASSDQETGLSNPDLTENPFAIMSYITVGLSLAIFYMNYQRRRFLIK